MATPSLRPLSVGEILDAGIKVCTRHWKALSLCVVVPVLPLAILQVLLIASMDPEALELLPEEEDTSLAADDLGAEFWVTTGIAGVIGIVLFVVVQTACFKAVADAWLGAKPEVGRSLRFGFMRAPKVFLLSLIWLPAVGLGFVACLVPGVWLFTVWALSVAALLFERVGPFKALGRSYSLVQERFWATFLLLLVSFLLVSILGGILSAVPSVVAEIVASENRLAASVASVVGTTLANVITYPYSAAIVAILYFDQRVRKEGFDVQMLAAGLGREFDPDAPIPAPLQHLPVTGPPPQAWQPQGQWGGWNAPSHEAEPLRWGPGAQSPPPARPPDDRPPEESPWMRPTPGAWTPPGEESRWAGPGEGAPQAPPNGPGTGGSPWAPPPSEPGTGEPPPSGPGPGGSPWAPPSGPGASQPATGGPPWSPPSRPDAGEPGSGGMTSGSPLGDAPTEPLPPAADDDDVPSDPLPPPPGEESSWESRWGAQSPFGESPWQDKDDDEDTRKQDKDRADWQPPEEPRGPGGL